MTWESLELENYEFLEDLLKSSMNNLKPLVQNFLIHLLEHLHEFISLAKIQTKSLPAASLKSQAPLSNILIGEISSFNISGSTGIDY
jgi:hypothetical protein